MCDVKGSSVFLWKRKAFPTRKVLVIMNVLERMISLEGIAKYVSLSESATLSITRGGVHIQLAMPVNHVGTLVPDVRRKTGSINKAGGSRVCMD